MDEEQNNDEQMQNDLGQVEEGIKQFGKNTVNKAGSTARDLINKQRNRNRKLKLAENNTTKDGFVSPGKKLKGKKYQLEGKKKIAEGTSKKATGDAMQAAAIATKGAAQGVKAAGNAAQALDAIAPGVGTTIKAGAQAAAAEMEASANVMQESGKKTSEIGKKEIKSGKEKIKRGQTLEQTGRDIGDKQGSVPNEGMPKFPKIPVAPNIKNIIAAAKKKKGFKLALIIGVVALIVFLLIIVFMVGSEVKDGSYIEGDESNVPYVVSSQLLKNIVIGKNSSGELAFMCMDEDGNLISIDEALDNVLNTLEANNPHICKDLGDTDEERKAFLKILVKAEIATQYPDITGGKLTNVGGTTSYSGGDYCVDTSQPGAARVCTEQELTEMVNNNASLSDEAKQNLLSVVPDLVTYQETYHVNAVFAMAVVKAESGCGTGWDLIDKSTYNWLSIMGSYNGASYVDRNGTSWKKYSSYSEAMKDFFDLISKPDGYYFGSGKYSVATIAPTYCNQTWGDVVNQYMAEFYAGIGVSDSESGTENENTSEEAQDESSENSEGNGTDTDVNGVIKIKRKYTDGSTKTLTYLDETAFNSLISSGSSDVMNYFTLKKSSSNNSSTTTTGVPTSLVGDESMEQIWNFLVGSGCTEQGAAALMGNLQAESGCRSVRVQGDYAYGNAEQYSADYTQKVDSGEISESSFVNNGPNGGGYGLAQWTDPSRKQKLYTYAKSHDRSIGDLQTQLEYLISELSTNSYYAQIWQLMQSSTDINQICDLILVRFENPADIEGNRPKRRNNASEIYNKYKGTSSAENNSSSESSNNNSNSNSDDDSDDDSNGSSSSSSNNSSSGSQIDSNGVRIVKGGNTEFLEQAIKAHKYIRENNYTYGQGRDLPVTAGDCGYIDCAAYVSMALDYYGCKDWPYYPHQLTSSNVGECKELTKVYEGSASSISQVPELKSGDIVVMPGHTQIFYGYDSDNKEIWLNAGSNASISLNEGSYAYGSCISSAQIVNAVYRVNGGGSSVASFDKFLFVGDSRYVGIESELKGLGADINVCAVGGSTSEQWLDTTSKGSGVVKGTSITLPEPENVSHVSVMLGVNSTSQITELEQVLQNLHTRYPNATIFYNSAYHIAANYVVMDAATMNANIDSLNQTIKTYSEGYDWLTYVDVTDGLNDENGYLKSADGEGIHLIGEGKATLVNNIKNKIMSSATNSNSGTADHNSNSQSPYQLVVANYSSQSIYTVDSFDEFLGSQIISTSSGTTGPGSRFSETPPEEVKGNSVTTTYTATAVDYQSGVKEHTLYFDFLWAIFIDTRDKDLVEDWAQIAINSTIDITVYSEETVNSSTSRSDTGTKSVTKKEGTTTTTKTMASKLAITNADTWLMEYSNDAPTYAEYQAKTSEVVREKTEEDDEIMKLMRKDEDRLESMNIGAYKVERMIKENEKVSFMFDIYRYFIDKAMNKKTEYESLQELIDVGSFDINTFSGSFGNASGDGSMGGEEIQEAGIGYNNIFKVGTRTYINYKQLNPNCPWLYESLAGFPSSMLGQSGCAINAIAVILSGYGINMTPKEVNDYAKSTSTPTCHDLTLGALLGKHVTHHASGNLSEVIIQQLNSGKPCMVRSSAYSSSHYFCILAISEDGTQVYVSDVGGEYPGQDRDGWQPISFLSRISEVFSIDD